MSHNAHFGQEGFSYLAEQPELPSLQCKNTSPHISGVELDKLSSSGPHVPVSLPSCTSIPDLESGTSSSASLTPSSIPDLEIGSLSSRVSDPARSLLLADSLDAGSMQDGGIKRRDVASHLVLHQSTMVRVSHSSTISSHASVTNAEADEYDTHLVQGGFSYLAEQLELPSLQVKNTPPHISGVKLDKLSSSGPHVPVSLPSCTSIPDLESGTSSSASLTASSIPDLEIGSLSSTVSDPARSLLLADSLDAGSMQDGGSKGRDVASHRVLHRDSLVVRLKHEAWPAQNKSLHADDVGVSGLAPMPDMDAARLPKAHGGITRLHTCAMEDTPSTRIGCAAAPSPTTPTSSPVPTVCASNVEHLTPTSTNTAIETASPSMECIHPDEDNAQLHLERRPDSPCISATAPKGSSNPASLHQAEHDHIHKSASLPVESHFLAMRLACFLQMVASVFLLHIARHWGCSNVVVVLYAVLCFALGCKALNYHGTLLRITRRMGWRHHFGTIALCIVAIISPLFPYCPRGHHASPPDTAVALVLLFVLVRHLCAMMSNIKVRRRRSAWPSRALSRPTQPRQSARHRRRRARRVCRQLMRAGLRAQSRAGQHAWVLNELVHCGLEVLFFFATVYHSTRLSYALQVGVVVFFSPGPFGGRVCLNEAILLAFARVIGFDFLVIPTPRCHNRHGFDERWGSRGPSHAVLHNGSATLISMGGVPRIATSHPTCWPRHPAMVRVSFAAMHALVHAICYKRCILTKATSGY